MSLQENNHIALVDLETASVIGEFPAGEVDLDQTDTVEEDRALISLTDSLFDVPREPEAVTWIGDDRLGTANEGYLFGGSRGFSVFDTDGTALFDSGNALAQTYSMRLSRCPRKVARVTTRSPRCR